MQRYHQVYKQRLRSTAKPLRTTQVTTNLQLPQRCNQGLNTSMPNIITSAHMLIRNLFKLPRFQWRNNLPTFSPNSAVSNSSPHLGSLSWDGILPRPTHNYGQGSVTKTKTDHVMCETTRKIQMVLFGQY